MSAVFLGDLNYEIDLFDDGTVATNRMAVNRVEPGLATICRPVGVLRMLGVFVDYGNTGISQDQAYAALAAAQVESADWHRAYAAANGLPAPLLELHITPAFISAPPVPGEFLTASQFNRRRGYLPAITIWSPRSISIRGPHSPKNMAAWVGPFTAGAFPPDQTGSICT